MRFSFSKSTISEVALFYVHYFCTQTLHANLKRPQNTIKLGKITPKNLDQILTYNLDQLLTYKTSNMDQIRTQNKRV